VTGFSIASAGAAKRLAGSGILHRTLFFELASFFQKHFDGNTSHGQPDQNETNNYDDQEIHLRLFKGTHFNSKIGQTL